MLTKPAVRITRHLNGFHLLEASFVNRNHSQKRTRRAPRSYIGAPRPDDYAIPTCSSQCRTCYHHSRFCYSSVCPPAHLVSRVFSSLYPRSHPSLLTFALSRPEHLLSTSYRTQGFRALDNASIFAHSFPFHSSPGLSSTFGALEPLADPSGPRYIITRASTRPASCATSHVSARGFVSLPSAHMRVLRRRS